jgi:hypothetical protein
VTSREVGHSRNEDYTVHCQGRVLRCVQLCAQLLYSDPLVLHTYEQIIEKLQQSQHVAIGRMS